MKKFIAWLFIGPILLFFVWLACLGSEELRRDFIAEIDKFFKDVLIKVEKRIRGN